MVIDYRGIRFIHKSDQTLPVFRAKCHIYPDDCVSLKYYINATLLVNHIGTTP